MNIKPGGGKRPQLYDEKTGRYVDGKINPNEEIDFSRLMDLKQYHHGGVKLSSIAFPTHRSTDLYCMLYVNVIGEYGFYKDAFIDDRKINEYLFIHQAKDDKSKFMIEILGYSNNEEGQAKAKRDILYGTRFETMKYNSYVVEALKVKCETNILGKNGRIYKIHTGWQLKEDFSLRFITLIPGGE